MPNPANASAEELEAAIKCAVSKRSRDRLHAIKALILGIGREQVEKLFSISPRTLRAWVGAWNEQGIDGLIERSHPGRPAIIRSEQAEHYKEILEQPGKVGEQHWTAVKFHGWLRREMDLEIGYSTVVRFLHEQGFCLKVPQPWPDRQDEQLRQAFCARLREFVADENVELWFCDETGIQGDPRPRRRWAQKGSKPRVTHNGEHVRMNVCGMIAPRTGEAFLLEFSHSDTEVFQVFLDEANKDLALERKRQILIMDNASWHKSKSLQWGRFEPVYLPPYSPDLNPIERLWLVIKAEWFTDFIAKDRDALIDRLDKALRWAIGRSEANKQTCRIRQEI